MKILCFSDLHGSVSAVDNLVSIAMQQRADMVVVCGDLFGGSRQDNLYIADSLLSIDGIVLLQGNNDFCNIPSNVVLLPSYMLSLDKRKVMFSHGDKYNCYNIPPILGNGDLLVYGHSHTSSIAVNSNGIVLVNVGSIALPRNCVASYTLIDNQQVVSCTLTGHKLSSLVLY